MLLSLLALTLSPQAGLAPLDFLVGHCWKGVLPTGEANIHCFDRVDGQVRDRHEVLREGRKVYGGETLYGWNAAESRVDYVYRGMGGGEMRGSMKPDGADLDFGTTDHVAKDGKRIAITVRWVRVAPDAYEARNTSPTPGFTHNVRYVRAD
jgi:beta-xylosidase